MLFLDFETYYDDDYSLRKIETWPYIRDGRFQCLGMAAWMPGMAAVDYIPPEQVKQFLHNLPPMAAVAHNAAFDGAIASHHYNWTPTYWYDTKLMARYAISQGWLPPDHGTSIADFGNKGDTRAAVDAGGRALADYAAQDVLIMMDIFRRFRPHIPQMELDLMNLHIKMTTEPVLRVDCDLLMRVAAEEKHPMAVALRKNDNFITALRHYGIEPETKISPRTGKPTWAFAKNDTFMKALAQHPHPAVRKLHELRTEAGSNIVQTRAKRFLDVGNPFPVPLLYLGAHTGRSSGTQKLNLQNLNRTGPLRQAVQAPPGHKLIITDLSQIEVRILAWLAQDQALMQIFREGRDPYIAFAADVMFRKSPDAVTKEERRISKPPILGCGYGQGWRGLKAYAAAMGVILTDVQAVRAVEGYRSMYRRIPVYWDWLMDAVRRDHCLTLPTGRKLIYPDMFRRGRDIYYRRPVIFSKQRKGVRDEAKIFGGLLAENQTQAVARDVVMWQTLQLWPRWKVVLSIHDEAILCVPEDQAEQALEEMLEAFSTTPPWADGLPVTGEGGIYDNYGKI
jgi:DNA polymerase